MQFDVFFRAITLIVHFEQSPGERVILMTLLVGSISVVRFS